MKRLFTVLSLLMAASMVLAACAPAATPTAAPTTAPTTAPTAAPTEVVTEAPTAAPTEPPTTRHGGWLDEIDFSLIDGESSIAQVKAGAVDIYTYGLASDKFPEIKDSGLCYNSSPSVFYGIQSNPAVFTDTTKINPFHDRKIREALNWLIDRNYINQEIYAGGSLTAIEPFIAQMPEYTAIVDTVRGLEAYYAYNLDKAKQVVNDEMTAAGATLGSDGKWQFSGAPVVVTFLIRNDGDGTRLPMGDYISDQLEAVGFTVNRAYGTRTDTLTNVVQGTDPTDGQWNLYTAAFINNALPLDEANSFQLNYLPEGAFGAKEQLLNEPDPEFSKVGNDLANGAFTTLEQRDEWMRKAATLAPQDSLYTWVIDGQTYYFNNCDLDVTYDVGVGDETAWMFPQNLRWHGTEGGQVKVGTSTLFTGAYSPMDSGNFVSDALVQNAVGSQSFMPDPYTGLYWPWRAESATVTVQSGIPVAQAETSKDWLTLETADSIPVPADAWYDWDAAAQTFIPAGEGKTAKVKACITYPADMFDTVKWHDGSNLSVADFVMNIIMNYDLAKPESANYDENQVALLDNFLTYFKGVQIVSTDPLSYCTYTDQTFKDAELIPANNDWWPDYVYTEAPWEVLAIGNITDAAGGQASWGQNKATDTSTEWISQLGGPTLDFFSQHLDEQIANPTIPFEPTLGQYLTVDEAKARYQALKDFYTANGHMFVGTGAYVLSSVDLNAGSAVVKNNPDYVDLADRWAKFSTPPLAEGTLDGPGQVTIGQPADFTLTLTTKSGDPYPSDQVKAVKFLLYDETGATVFIGEGTPGDSDGVYTLSVPADETAKLTAGTGRIEAAAVLIPAAVPAFATLDYVVSP